MAALGVFVQADGYAAYSVGQREWRVPISPTRPSRRDFESANDPVRMLQAIHTLDRSIPLPTWAETRLTAWLENPTSGELMPTICYLLGRGRRHRSLEALRKAEQTSRLPIRIAAAVALLLRGRRASIRRLLREELSADDALSAVRSIMNYAAGSALIIPKRVLKCVLSSGAPGARLLVAEVRIAQGDRAAASELQSVLENTNTDPLDRAAAARMLIQSRQRGVRHYLLQYMRDRANDPWPRLVIAQRHIDTLPPADLRALIDEMSGNENPFYRRLAAQVAVKRRRALSKALRQWAASEPDPLVRAVLAPNSCQK